MLIDAGWKLGVDWINELELAGMPNQSGVGYDGFIVHNEEGERIERRVLERRFERILEGAQIETKGIHCLRHTYGTQLYEQTQDMQLVSHQLRHSDPAFTSRTYVHKSNERAADQIKNIRI